MDYSGFLTWAKNVLVEANDVASWLVTPINIGDVSVSPIVLFSVGGLLTFIAIAVVSWLLSSSPL